MPRSKLLPLLFAAVAAFQIVPAQDWAQWRGPNRDGVVKDFVAPANWPEKLKLIWKTEVGSCLDLKTGKILWSKSYSVAFTKNQYAREIGKGPHSTPVLYDGKLYTL